MCPNRRPLRPQQPIFGTFLRGDLHFGRHTTSSADLTATRLGELHDMRVQHAGDTLCDDLVSCKPPHHWRCGGRRKDVHPTGAPASAKKLAQHGPSSGYSAKKLAQQAQNTKFGVFSARRANFFALSRSHNAAGRTFSRPHETSDTFARSFASTHETGNAFARQQCRKIKHFVRAKVPAVSADHEYRAAKVSTVSARQSVAPKRQVVQYL